MRFRAIAAIGVAALLGGALYAQAPPNSIDLGTIDFPLPQARVGVPYDVNF